MDAKDVAASDVGVALGGAEGGVTEEGLNVADVGAAFKEVGGKGVAEAVNRKFFGDFGATDSVVENVLGRTDCQRTSGSLAGKKPGLYSVKSIVFIEKTGCLFGEQRAAVFTAFAKLNIDNLTGQINMLSFESDYFADSQTG